MAYCSLKGTESDIRIVFDQVDDIGSDERSSVPEYPTESGFKVSDATLKSLPSLTITGMLTAHSLASGGAHSITELEKVVYNLRELYRRSELCSFYQYNLKAYNNLIIEALSIKKTSEAMDSYTFDIEFKQMSFPVASIAKFYATEGDYTKAMIEQYGPAWWLEYIGVPKTESPFLPIDPVEQNIHAGKYRVNVP